MNRTSNWFRIFAAFIAVVFGAGIYAQSTLDTGSLRGRVTDDKGAPLPGAIIKAKGPQGTKAAETDSNGNYSIGFLTPGMYEVTASMDQFGSVVQSGVEIMAQRTSQQPFKMASGSGGTIITVKGTGAHIDTTATTSQTSVNLTTAIESFARDRSLTSTFDFSPGVVANSGVGGGNPSISGASGLENQYLIGGVNITNSGYGGIGAYDAVLGPVGVGVTTDFLEDLDIREGGFEAEYGGALGGVISASIKSGSNEFHGGIAAYYTPRSLQGTRRNIYLQGGAGNFHGYNGLDASVQLGGPIIKDRLFFFVAYNPTWNKNFTRFDIEASDIAKDQIVLPNANREYDFGTTRVDNYAAHLTWQINEKHKLDFIAFGSPSPWSGGNDGLLRSIGRRITNPSTQELGTAAIPAQPTPGGAPVVDSVLGATGSFRINDRSYSVKYFGTFASWMNVEAQISYHMSDTEETPSAGADVISYTDIRRTSIFNAMTLAGRTPYTSPAQYTFGGLGLFQGGAHDRNLNYTLKITHNFNWAGSHELKWGGDFSDIKFRENPIRSGPRDGNGPIVYLNSGNIADSSVRIRTGASAQVRCTTVDRNGPTGAFGPAALAGTGAVCKTDALGRWRYRLNRGNFNPASEDTTNKEYNLFVQDKWTISNYLTLNLGVRYTHSKLANPTNFSMRSIVSGAPLIDSSGNPVGTHDELCTNATPGNPACYPYGLGNFQGASYKFKGEFAPRIGLSWDLLGNGKSKLYANYARMFERIPNDLAIRSFGNEFGLTRATYLTPDLATQTGSASGVGGNTTRVAAGTRLPYKDDFILGYQFEVAPRFIVDIKGTYRKQGRVLEDTQAGGTEAILNNYYSYLNYYPGGCANCPANYPGFKLFPGFGSANFGQYVLANVGENGPTNYAEVYQAGTWRDGLCPGSGGVPYGGADCDHTTTGAFTPVTFGSPSSKYQALSVTATKQKDEGGHFSMQATYRIAKLWGNYEGLFRNDNGQDDPNISALFDFPHTNLTRSQYTNGRLNTDTPHSLRINVGYDDLFIKNLSAAVTFKWNSGQLRTPTLAHPVYQNAGEIPGIHPQYFDFSAFGLNILKSYTDVARGYNGRNTDIATWDVKLGYRWNLGKSNLDFNVLFTNLFNENSVDRHNDFVENQTGILNPNYGTPLGVHEPRTIRLGAKWSF